MKKNYAAKIVCMILALVMVAACFAACGETKTNDDNNGGTTADGTWYFGGTGPLTGSAAQYGNAVKEGAQLAVDEINAAGGINGYKINFDMKDDENDPEKAGVAYDTLMDAGMQISLGSVTTNPCLTFADKANADNLFFMTPSASAADVIVNKYAFRVCFGDPDQGYLAAEELAKTYTKIGVIYDESDTYSTGIFEAFETKMKELGKTDYNVQQFNSDSNRDFSTQVAARKDCDVIFLPIYYTEAGLIAQEAKKIGCNAVLFGCDGLDGVAESITANSIPNVVKYITPFDINSTDETVSSFVKAFREKYNHDPDQFAADAYDVVKAIAAAMTKAEVKDVNIKAADLADIVYKTITSSDFTYTGATGTMTWNEDGAPNKVPVIVDLSK